MFKLIRSYALALLLALLLHLLVGLALFAGWNSDPSPPVLVKPKLIKTQLIQLKPKSKPAPKVTPPKIKPVEIKKAVPKVLDKKPVLPPVEKKPDPRLVKELEAKRKAEQERAERLDQLVSTSFESALNDESIEQAENESSEIAKSYIQGIYELIVANWSRPPSARNGMRATLQVDLVPTGDVVQVVVMESSGNMAFDRSAETAVRKAGKFEVPKESHIFEKNFRSFPVIFKPEDLLR
ncbi:MAG: cell envelope integrity protein TolA [Pseudomonadales bacterium]|nr:cell envelope integrity protein TolA [Pseudomonadales bacterium]